MEGYLEYQEKVSRPEQLWSTVIVNSSKSLAGLNPISADDPTWSSVCSIDIIICVHGLSYLLYATTI